MIKTYICGSNLHEQIRNHGDEDSGDDGDTDDHVAVSFASFVPLDSALENDDIEVIALSASQILYRKSCTMPKSIISKETPSEVLITPLSLVWHIHRIFGSVQAAWL